MGRLLLLSWIAFYALPGWATQTDLSASAALRKVGFEASDETEVLEGGFVHRALVPATPRDLAVAMAFLVRRPPSVVDHEIVQQGLVFERDPNTITSGEFSPEGSAADLEKLELTAGELSLYGGASPGVAVNLTAAEAQKLAAAGKGPDLQRAVSRLLLGRYRAYSQKGLAGVLPYARGGGSETDVASDLRRMSNAQSAALLEESLRGYLLGLPSDRPKGLVERFTWSHYRARDEPTLILTHVLARPVGSGFELVQRQYYVSRGFNVEQAVATLLPVTEGTLFVYTNHTTTDQIGGIGASAKRRIGEELMARRLQAIFEVLRTSGNR